MVRLERGILMASDPDGYAQKHVGYDERWRRDRGFVERLTSALRHVERLRPSELKVFKTEAQGKGHNSTIEIEPDGVELEWQKCDGGWRRFSPRE
jgi:hypothetical protein